VKGIEPGHTASAEAAGRPRGGAGRSRIGPKSEKKDRQQDPGQNPPWPREGRAGQGQARQGTATVKPVGEGAAAAGRRQLPMPGC